MLKNRAAIQHIYTVGPTGSGKSHIVRKIARAVRLAGYPVYVCTAKAHPKLREMLGGREHPDVTAWKRECGASVVTHEREYFSNLFWSGKIGPSVVVFDEAANDIGTNPGESIMGMFRVCRDLGIMLCANAQNYTAVSPQVRNQCKRLHLFNCAKADVGYVINDYRFDDASEQTIRRSTNLGLYEHLHIDTRNRNAEIVGKDGKPL